MALTALVERILPDTLRAKLFLLSLLMLSAPVATIALFVEHQGQEARQEEKLGKLFALANILDRHLGPGFDTLLRGYKGADGDRAAKIAFLNGRLREFTDLVAASSPGLGVGYYSRDLNAIITYGPSEEFGHTVGISIPPDHPGWQVMDSGRKLVGVGTLVRGPIMNAMWPIVRGGKVIGYIWANELIESIENEAWELDRAILAVTILCLILGLGMAHAFSTRLAREVTCITGGLARLRFDLTTPLRRPSGELGDIADAINAMARTLLDVRSLNENILDSIADGVIAVDVDGTITSANPAAQRMMGLAVADMVGKPYRTLYATRPEFASILLDTLDSGQDHVGVTLDFPLGEQSLHVSASSSLLKDGTGAVIGGVIVFKDLSEEDRLQKQVMRADRLAALGELMAGIAHEIRNPLTSIRGFMQYLESCDSLDEWKRHAPLIVRQVDSLNRIVTELLEFGRQRPPRIAPVRIDTLIREITLLMGAKSNAPIVLDVADGVPVIEADGEALKQVILNLVINATQAIEGSGRIIISVRDGGDGEVVVEVTDNGIGIAPEHLEKVFNPFFSTKPAGTGLGLPMVHRIMDAHNGVIAIDSAPGVGTRVTLRLPIRQRSDVTEAS